MAQKIADQIIAEMASFAAFSAAEQRYVRRSLDVAFDRSNALACWARGPEEASDIEAQADRYSRLVQLRDSIPDEDEPGMAEPFVAELIEISGGDLAEGKICSFASFRFLYERLMGRAVAPWLMSAFCAAAGLPRLHPEHREQLLRSISRRDVMTASCSVSSPVFFPTWVDKVPQAVN